MNQIIGKQKKTSTVTHSFKYRNSTTTDSQIIADKFNEYFVGVGPTLAAKIENDVTESLSYVRGNYPNSLYVNPATDNEVMDVITNLKLSSPGWDNISAKVVKHIARSILRPFTHICNLSFSSGIVPIEMKLACVIPIFKSGDTSSFTNYRPISVLPVFSKILEKLILID